VVSPASTGAPAVTPRSAIAPDSARALQVKCLMFDAPLIHTRLSGRIGRSGADARAAVGTATAIRGVSSQLALIMHAPDPDRRRRQLTLAPRSLF
jgi:hypothetical protein